MKKNGILVLLIFLVGSCHKPDQEEVANNLQGYWEIDKVMLKDGSEKVYEINTTIDFFKITTQNKGFRKKVQPSLVGKYYGSDDAEQFEIIEIENELWLNYSTKLMSWKEKIIDIDNTQLILRNENGLTYYYKPYQPLEITE
jgi:hypothetical protein